MLRFLWSKVFPTKAAVPAPKEKQTFAKRSQRLWEQLDIIDNVMNKLSDEKDITDDEKRVIQFFPRYRKKLQNLQNDIKSVVSNHITAVPFSVIEKVQDTIDRSSELEPYVIFYLAVSEMLAAMKVTTRPSSYAMSLLMQLGKPEQNHMKEGWYFIATLTLTPRLSSQIVEEEEYYSQSTTFIYESILSPGDKYYNISNEQITIYNQNPIFVLHSPKTPIIVPETDSSSQTPGMRRSLKSV